VDEILLLFELWIFLIGLEEFAYIELKNIGYVSINDYVLRNQDYKYGLDIYDSLIEMVKLNYKLKDLDLRAFRVVVEHK